MVGSRTTVRATKPNVLTRSVRPPDYRDELEGLILEHFLSRPAFAEAAGLLEDQIDDVLAGRKDLSMGSVNESLARIGYRLHINPALQREKSC